MESNRQKKIAGVLQIDLVDVLQGAAREGGLKGIIISVSKVTVTTDLSVAKVYLSVFPSKNAAELLVGIKSNKAAIKHEIAQRTKHQLRRMPELFFFIDDSLEYIENIEKSLKGDDNPITDRDLLDDRNKI